MRQIQNAKNFELIFHVFCSVCDEPLVCECVCVAATCGTERSFRFAS